MLAKIIAIKNIGRFHDTAASGDVTFKKHTMIFAENGRGKTTLCSILRSFQTGDAAYILGRRTLGSPGQPEVRLLVDGAGVKFHNGAWDKTLPQIAIFDGSFISENVYSGDAVATEHRRNLYRVIIGSQGVGLARHIDELDGQIRARNGEINEARAALQRQIPQGITVDVFLALPEDAEVDAKIATKEREAAALRQAQQIKDRAELAAIALPEFPAGFAALLGKTLAGVSAEAERRVHEHMRAHSIDETWIDGGMDHIHDDKCPFCGQGVKGLALIDAYKLFFSKAYIALSDEARNLGHTIAELFSDRALAGIDRTVDQNAAAVEFWRQYADFNPPQADGGASKAVEALTALRDAAGALLRRKTDAPLEALAPDHAFEQVKAAADQAREAVAKYNEAVATANAVIGARKQQTAAGNAAAVQSELAQLSAGRTRHTPAVKQACDAYQAMQAAKAELESEKTQARTALDEHTDQLIARYGQSINRYLERFNSGFSITTPTYTYRGGPPSSSYQIVINRTPVDLGDATTSLAQPSFKNTLSAGDKSTLALAFFLAQLEQDPDRAQKIAVLDDPFTSQDEFRRLNTIFEIKKLGADVSQIVLLSHDPHFLKQLWDRLQPDERKTIRLGRVGPENTAIVPWDIEEALKTVHRANIEALLTFHNMAEGNPREVVLKMRTVLETHCLYLYPTLFDGGDTLGVIVGKIRNAGATHPLFGLYAELDEINEYSKRYHHGENPGAALEAIDDAALKGFVRRTLICVGGFEA